MMTGFILLLVLLFPCTTNSFQYGCRQQLSSRGHQSLLGTRSSDELLNLVGSEESKDETMVTRIGTIIDDLETHYTSPSDDDKDRFQNLLGNYNVSYVKTRKPDENPVGGWWSRKNGIAQRILRTKRTLQHILPVNTTGIGACVSSNDEMVVGEAVNVIMLEALFGILRVTVVLRGDAVPLTMEERTNMTRVLQPLTSQAVKALFDSPRIILGKTGRFFNLNIGPNSLVLLDTLFVDKKVRIGMGGTSGTRFVFSRCSNDDDEAEEYLQLLRRKPAKKTKALLVLGAIASTGAYGAVTKGGLRLIGGTVCVISSLLGLLVATSSGGIESNDRGVRFRKEEDPSIENKP